MVMCEVNSYRFTKQQRLLSPKQYKCVFDECSFKIHQPNFMWFVRVSSNNLSTVTDAHNRLGLAITKKKVKRAHERNRIKRLTREYFRYHQALLLNPVELVLTIKHSPENLSNEEFIGQLMASFKLINHKLKSYNI